MISFAATNVDVEVTAPLVSEPIVALGAVRDWMTLVTKLARVAKIFVEVD